MVYDFTLHLEPGLLTFQRTFGEGKFG